MNETDYYPTHTVICSYRRTRWLRVILKWNQRILGRGSVLNEAGEVEMHAMVMRGDTLDVGSVLCIQNVKNPVQAAKLVLDKVIIVQIYK